MRSVVCSCELPYKRLADISLILYLCLYPNKTPPKRGFVSCFRRLREDQGIVRVVKQTVGDFAKVDPQSLCPAQHELFDSLVGDRAGRHTMDTIAGVEAHD